jgi:TP901 family phage tail tape measure protein
VTITASAFEIAFTLNAAMNGGFAKTFSSAAGTMGELQKRMSALSQNQGSIAAFGKLQAAANANGAALNAAQKRVKELGAQMKATTTPSEQLKRQFTAANAEVNKLQTKLMGQRKELGELRTTLSAAGVDTKNFSNEQVRLAQSTELATQAAKLQQAQARVQETQGAVDATKQRLGNMKGEILASAGIVMAFKAPIQQAATFEQAMARVQAVTGNNTSLKAGAENMKMLSEQARQLGRDTQFTATQAANSQEMLARAGFNTTEIMAAMPGLLNMASAEGMELAQAADITASVVRGFNLEADQSTRVADVLAKASATTNTSIATLGESMKVVAPVAAGLGINLEQTAAMIGVMGNAGIKGSLAGNALKAGLLRLSKEPKAVEEALGDLGLASRDAKGQLYTLPSLMKDLNTQMKGMGDADRMEMLTKIFGSEAASGMLAIMNATTGEVDLIAQLEAAYYGAAGTSSEMADVMNNTAQGAMARLGSATESLSIDVGNVLLPAFTLIVDSLATFIAQVSGLAQKYPLITKVVVGGAAAFGAATVAITTMRLAVLAAKMPFLLMQASMARAKATALLSGKTSMWQAAKTKALALAQGAAAVKAKALALAQGAWGKVMKLGRGLLDAGKYVALHAKQIAITAATKGWALAQGAWNAVMKFGKTLLNVGQLVLYHAKQIVIAAATKAWTAAQWLWNTAMNANPIGLIINWHSRPRRGRLLALQELGRGVRGGIRRLGLGLGQNKSLLGMAERLLFVGRDHGGLRRRLQPRGVRMGGDKKPFLRRAFLRLGLAHIRMGHR